MSSRKSLKKWQEEQMGLFSNDKGGEEPKKGSDRRVSKADA